MRLQLSLLAVLVLVRPAGAEDAWDLGARVDVYADEWITVVSPTSRVALARPERFELEARYGVDMVSGATRALHVDAVSGATRFSETRHQIDLSGRAFVARDLSLGAFYTVSSEPDSATHAPGVSLVSELFERRSKLSLGYRVELGSVGLVDNRDFTERAVTHVADLEWAQILDRRTVLRFALTGEAALCGELIGCHASPYRFVPVRDPSGAMRVALRERHPEERFRGAAALGVSRHLGAGFAVHARYRFYADSWQLTGQTAELAVAHELEDFVLRLDGRFTYQDAASFYRERYTGAGDTLPAYRSADREMAGMLHGSVGGRAAWRLTAIGPLDKLEMSLRVAHLVYRYPEFEWLPERNAWLAGGGISGTF